MPVLVLEGAQELAVHARGYVGNSIATSSIGKSRTTAWKLNVAAVTRAGRSAAWRPGDVFAITIGYSFHLPSHGNRYLDIENFLKPTLDAVAAGLFCDDATDLATLARWDYDDSNFAHLLAHRLPWAPSADKEGAEIFVSAMRRS
jgi:hypothetical protein